MRNRKLIGHYDPVRFWALLKKQDLWCIGRDDEALICTGVFIYRLTNWEYTQLILTQPWTSEIKDSWNKNWERIDGVVQEMKTPMTNHLRAMSDAESFLATEPKTLKACPLMTRIPQRMASPAKGSRQVYLPLFHDGEDEAHRFVTWVNEAFLDVIPDTVLKARTSTSVIAAIANDRVIGVIMPGFLDTNLNAAVRAYFDTKSHKPMFYEEYAESGTCMSYTRWLENQVTNLRNAAKMEVLMRRSKTCVCLRELFGNLPGNSQVFTAHGYRIIHDQNEDSFDLIDHHGTKLCCDSEECEILNIGSNDITFRTLGTDHMFILSRDEVNIAVFN